MKREAAVVLLSFVLVGCARPSGDRVLLSPIPEADLADMPWRVRPSAADTFHTWYSGRALPPSDTSQQGGAAVAFGGLFDSTVAVRSAVRSFVSRDTIAFWIRASEALSLTILPQVGSVTDGRHAWRASPAVAVRGDGAWREISIPLSVPAGVSWGFVRIHVRHREGAGAYALTEPTLRLSDREVCRSLFAWTEAELSIHFVDDSVRVRWTSSDLLRPESVQLLVRDARRATVMEVPGTAGQPAWSGTIPVGPLEPGWYAAMIRARECTRSWAFVVVPAILRDGGATTLGLHVEFDSVGFQKARYLGAGWIRAHRVGVTTWPVIEPSEGEHQWPDSVLYLAAREGLQVLGSLDRTPEWASSSPDAAPYPWPSFYFGAAAHAAGDMNDWAAYVASVVSRYRDLAAVWEVWNEPDIHFLAVEPGTTHLRVYQALLRTADGVMARACAACRLAGPSVAYALETDRITPAPPFAHLREPEFLEGFLASEEVTRLDVFTYHAYVHPGRCRSTPSCSPGPARAMVERMSDGGRRPVWRTEAGIHPEPGDMDRCRRRTDDERELAAIMTTDLLATLAIGVERLFAFHAFFSERPCEARALFFDGSRPRRTVAAFATLATMLRDRVVERGAVPQPFPSVTVLALLRGDDGPAWAIAPSAHAYEIRIASPGWAVTQWGAEQTASTAVIPAGEIVYLVGPAELFLVAPR